MELDQKYDVHGVKHLSWRYDSHLAVTASSGSRPMPLGYSPCGSNTEY